MPVVDEAWFSNFYESRKRELGIELLDQMNLSGECQDVPPLNDDHMQALAEFLKKNPQITSLNVSLNRLGPRGAACLASLAQITVLDISYNDIGTGTDKDVKDAMTALAKSKIQVLNLSTNNIDDTFAMALADIVTLISLDVSCNLKIGNRGLIALLGNPEITELSLSCKGFDRNKCPFSLFDQEGIDAILNNKTLKKLKLFDIEIFPPDVQEKLKKLLFSDQASQIVMEYLGEGLKIQHLIKHFFLEPNPTSRVSEAAAPQNSSADFSHKP